MTINELKSAFVYAYQQNAAAVYFVPGNIYLIGEHINHFESDDFQPALSVGIYLLLSKNNENCFKFWSLNEPEAINWNINQPIPKNINSWVKYPIGVINHFISSGVEIESGFDLLFWGNIPKNIDLSPAKGLEIITDFALKDQFGLGSNNLNSLLFHQNNEHKFSFLNWNKILGESKNELYDNLNVKTSGIKIIISNTHIPHKVDASLLLKRISESKSAFEYLNKIRPLQILDEFTEDEFESMVSIISNPIAIKSAYHMITEVHLTKKAAKALKEANIFLFGQLMNASHNSLRDNLEIVTPEVDAMVAEALKIDGVIGSRMAGCGFGGCTISLVKDEAIDLFVKRVGDIYEDITGIKNHFYIAEIGDCTCKLYY